MRMASSRVLKLKASNESAPYNSPNDDIMFGRFAMRRFLLVFLSVLSLLVTGCKKGESNLTQSTPSPTASASPTPPPDTNRAAKFMVLLYHRFEDRPAELVTTPNDFRAQMKALKDNGISVISMQDLLAWRKGEKAIPSKSAVITIDDEWNSQYYVAWPIMKEFGSIALFSSASGATLALRPPFLQVVLCGL